MLTPAPTKVCMWITSEEPTHKEMDLSGRVSINTQKTATKQKKQSFTTPGQKNSLK